MQNLLTRRLYWRIWLVTVGVLLLFGGLILSAWFFSHLHDFEEEPNRILIVKDSNGYALLTVPVTPIQYGGREGVVFSVDLALPILWEESVFYLELPPARSPLARWGAPPWLSPVSLFFALFGLSFLLLAIAILPFMRRLTRRLERLQATVTTWGEGHLSTRAVVQGNDEVAFLASTFNDTATRIQKLLNSHKILLANASHELRSPLARLRMRLELSQQALPADEQAEVVRNLNELDGLIEEILLASRLDHPEAAPKDMEEVDLTGLLAEECARTDADLQAQSCSVLGSAKLLQRLFRNLLENAKRYSGDKGIEVQLGSDPQTPDQVLVRICDAGAGVDPALRERIFEPFFRLPGSSEEQGGAGLGLALVRSIAQHYGGTVVCIARPDGKTGACFEVRLKAL